MKWLHRFDRLTKFIRREDGSYTAEAVIWTPVFALLLALLADTSIIFGDQSLVLRDVQDANRGLSVGYFTSVSQATTYLQNRVQAISPNATISMTVNNGIISTVVTMPTRDLTATGLVSVFRNAKVSVASSQLSES